MLAVVLSRPDVVLLLYARIPIIVFSATKSICQLCVSSVPQEAYFDRVAQPQIYTAGLCHCSARLG